MKRKCMNIRIFLIFIIGMGTRIIRIDTSRHLDMERKMADQRLTQ
jgi:hypothetical protein